MLLYLPGDSAQAVVASPTISAMASLLSRTPPKVHTNNTVTLPDLTMAEYLAIPVQERSVFYRAPAPIPSFDNGSYQNSVLPLVLTKKSEIMNQMRKNGTAEVAHALIRAASAGDTRAKSVIAEVKKQEVASRQKLMSFKKQIKCAIKLPRIVPVFDDELTELLGVLDSMDYTMEILQYIKKAAKAKAAKAKAAKAKAAKAKAAKKKAGKKKVVEDKGAKKGERKTVSPPGKRRC